MGEITYLAKIIIFMGLGLAAIGALMLFFGKIPFLWRLPGDIYVQKGSFSFFFPLASCMLISVILSALIYFISRK